MGRIQLDQSALMGFRILPENQPGTQGSEARLGTKIGAKIGAKSVSDTAAGAREGARTQFLGAKIGGKKV